MKTLKKEIENIKASGVPTVPEIPINDTLVESPSLHVIPQVLTAESSQQTETVATAVTVQVEAETQTLDVNTIDCSCQSDAVDVNMIDCSCQTDIEDTWEVKHVKPPPIAPFLVPNLSDADSALVFEELTALHCVFRDMTNGSSDLDLVWSHSCSCGFFAALSSLRRRGEECRAEVSTLRAMMSQMLEKRAKKGKERQQAENKASALSLPSVLKKNNSGGAVFSQVSGSKHKPTQLKVSKPKPPSFKDLTE